jgi:hypothetical protein
MKKTWLQKQSTWIFLVVLSVFILSPIVLFSPNILDSLNPLQSTAVQTQTKPAEVEVRKPTPTPPMARPEFENGIVYPEWYSGGYGITDSAWQQGIITMQQKTNARWIEMPIQFSQDFNDSTTLDTRNTPSVANFQQGVRAARTLGYHVFVVPNFHVAKISTAWSGTIQFQSQAGMSQWFTSYWNIYKPYVQAAQEAGADQLAIGTELQWMQYNAPASMWNALITQVRSVFKGKLTYDANWEGQIPQPPGWWSNPDLSMIGISEYIPLEEKAISLTQSQFASLFKARVQSYLNTFAKSLNKPLIVTELGYRNGQFPGYRTWDSSYQDGPDPQAQAMALAAAIRTLVGDKHVNGLFIWGWNNTGPFDISSPTVTKAINQQYSSPNI